MEIRHWLKDIRISQELTQEQVAVKAGMASSTYAMYEQGRRKPNVDAAMKIAGALGFEWTIFFEQE